MFKYNFIIIFVFIIVIIFQDPVLRAKFAGKPEHVVNYMFLLAEEVRLLMAKLGFRTFQEMIGRVDKLRFNPTANLAKAKLLNMSKILTSALDMNPDASIRGGSVCQEHNLKDRMVNSKYMKYLYSSTLHYITFIFSIYIYIYYL